MSTFKWLIGELNNCRVGGVAKQLGKLLEIYVISLQSLSKKNKNKNKRLRTCCISKLAEQLVLSDWKTDFCTTEL